MGRGPEGGGGRRQEAGGLLDAARATRWAEAGVEAHVRDTVNGCSGEPPTNWRTAAGRFRRDGATKMAGEGRSDGGARGSGGGAGRRRVRALGAVGGEGWRGGGEASGIQAAAGPIWAPSGAAAAAGGAGTHGGR
nr:uncharacterized PE-PGRS family protein PE_PGRS54-like [Aegilops tauschii subsp. strangulata]